MTNEHDPTEDAVHELSNSIEPSLRTPDPSAIHAGLNQRQGFRQRILLGAAGAFVLLATIGGVFAMTRDDATSTTETAADDSADITDADASLQDLPTAAVAIDSAPVEIVSDFRSAALRVITIDGEPIDDVQRRYADAPSSLHFTPGGTGRYQTDTLTVSGSCHSRTYSIAWDLNQANTFRIVQSEQLTQSLTFIYLEQCEEAENGLLFLPGQTVAITSLSGVQGQVVIQSAGDPAWTVTADLFEPVPTVQEPNLGETVIPDIAGLNIAEAQHELLTHGIRSMRVDEASATVPEGLVITTSPPPGAIVEAGETIGVIISSGQREVVATTVPFTDPDSPIGFPTTTTAAPTTTSEPAPEPGPDAVLAIEADIDGEPGLEQIWLEPDGTLHAGELVGYATYWADTSDYWLTQQAELTTAQFDDDTMAIVLTLPVPDEEEDPPNIVQVFLVRESGLSRVFEQTLGTYGVQPLRFNGNGSVSYVEDGWQACRRGVTDIVTRQRLTFTPGDENELIQSSSEDTDLAQDCSQLAG